MSANATLFQAALAANSTAASFTAKTPTTTKPASGIDLQSSAIASALKTRPSFIYCQPYGKNANNLTFDMRIWGWTRKDTVWVPSLLLQVNVTLGDIAATDIGADTFLADTIAFVDGDANAEIFSPEGDVAASFTIHTRGCELVEFDFDRTGATECNCLVRGLDQT